MSDVVQWLCEAQRAVEVSLRPERTMQALREALDRGYVHIKFTETQGGTELGVPVDPERSDLSGLDLDAGTGRFTVAGELILDFIKVRCTATIDAPTLRGEGRLEVLAAPADATV